MILCFDSKENDYSCAPLTFGCGSGTEPLSKGARRKSFDRPKRALLDDDEFSSMLIVADKMNERDLWEIAKERALQMCAAHTLSCSTLNFSSKERREELGVSSNESPTQISTPLTVPPTTTPLSSVEEYISQKEIVVSMEETEHVPQEEYIAHVPFSNGSNDTEDELSYSSSSIGSKTDEAVPGDSSDEGSFEDFVQKKTKKRSHEDFSLSPKSNIYFPSSGEFITANKDNQQPSLSSDSFPSDTDGLFQKATAPNPSRTDLARLQIFRMSMTLEDALTQKQFAQALPAITEEPSHDTTWSWSSSSSFEQ